MNQTPKFFEVTCISPDEPMDAGRGRRRKTLLNAHQVLSIQDTFHPKDPEIFTSVRMLHSESEGHLYYVEEPYDTSRRADEESPHVLLLIR